MSQFPPNPPEQSSDWMSRVEWRHFSFANAFDQGWTVFKANYAFALVGSLAGGGVAFAAGMVGQMFSGILQAMIGATGGRGGGPPVALGLIVALVTIVLSLSIAVFVQWPAYASLAYAAVGVIRGEPITGRNVLRGFHKYTRAILAMLWIFLLSIAMVIPLAILMGCVGFGLASSKAGAAGGVVVILLVLVLIIPVMYVLIRVYPGVALAMDDHVHGLSPLECIKTSWEITKASSIEYFALIFVLYLMNMVGFLLLCLPAIFFTGPLALAIMGAAYHQLAFDAGMFKSRFVCRGCGYPLQPGMGVCPECGHNTPGAASANPSGTPPIGPGTLPPQDPFGPRDPNQPRDPFGPRQ